MYVFALDSVLLQELMMRKRKIECAVGRFKSMESFEPKNAFRQLKTSRTVATPVDGKGEQENRRDEKEEKSSEYFQSRSY